MDVITLEKTNEAFRLIYDVKGRFAVHRITAEEARYKLCKITKQGVAQKVNYLLSYLGTFITLHLGCSIRRYPRCPYHQIPKPRHQGQRYRYS